MSNRLIRRGILPIAACLALLAGSRTEARDSGTPLQGLFCNTQGQIDQALAHIDRGLTPNSAADLSNRHEIVCSYIDRLYFVVSHPIKVGVHHGRLPVDKYEGILTGVIVGGRLRPIFPSIRIYFITPDPPVEATLGQPT